jgi:hypothetical protein
MFSMTVDIESTAASKFDMRAGELQTKSVLYCGVELLGVDPIEQPSYFVVFAQCRPCGFEVVVAFLVYRNVLGPSLLRRMFS